MFLVSTILYLELSTRWTHAEGEIRLYIKLDIFYYDSTRTTKIKDTLFSTIILYRRSKKKVLVLFYYSHFNKLFDHNFIKRLIIMRIKLCYMKHR